MKAYTVESLEAESVARRAAWHAVRAAKKAGTITPPDRCQKCGAVGSTEGHHANYREPLAVVWLCLHCHRALHRAIRQQFRHKGKARA